MAVRSISRASRPVVSALAFAMIGLVATPAPADVISLRGGGKVRGKVIPNVREGSDRVTILPEKGRTPLVFRKEQVVEVTAEPGPLDEYLVRRDRASATADAQYELGLWCEDNKLHDLARLHYEAAVEHDESFAPAIKSWATSCTRTAGSPPTNSARPRGWSATRASGSLGTRRRNARRGRPRSPSGRRGRGGSASCARRSSPAPKTGSSRPVGN